MVVRTLCSSFWGIFFLTNIVFYLSIVMPLTIQKTSLPDVLRITLHRFADARGYFIETYNVRDMADIGVRDVFVQDNYSRSVKPGTIRGLHFQSPPYAQAKLVRVARGRIIDVAVDIRRGSPTYGQHVAVPLSSDIDEMLYIPVGFAHGFCTIEPDTEVHYKVTAGYAPTHDGGILWNDPNLGIAWPDIVKNAIVSDKDLKLPMLKNLTSPFDYAG